MELYIDHAATTSRAVLAFCEAEGIAPVIKPVALMKGEHHQPSFAALNPNRLVPVLVDDGFVLTESSAILRYLARKSGSRLYPEDLKQSARVDELMAWFEANLYKDLGFQLVYPQLMPHHKRPTEEANRITIEWGREQAKRWLRVLDEHYLGPDARFLVSGQLTIADYFGASILSLGELVGCTFEELPNVRRWYQHVTSQESWVKVNGAFMGFAESLRGQPLLGLA